MMPSQPLPLETETVLRSELNTGERLLWTGQPIANRSGWGSLPLVLFGIPWTAFSVFWELMAISMTGGMKSHNPSEPSFPFNLFPVLFPLFGIPFILIGLWMLSSPYWMRKKAQKIVYAVTDKRALILSPSWRGAITVRSITPEDTGRPNAYTEPGWLRFTGLYAPDDYTAQGWPRWGQLFRDGGL